MNTPNWNQMDPKTIKGPLFTTCMNDLRSSIKRYMQNHPEEDQAEITARADGDFMVIPSVVIKQEVVKEFSKCASA